MVRPGFQAEQDSEAQKRANKKKAWLVSHARTTTRRMEEPLPGAGAPQRNLTTTYIQLSKLWANRQKANQYEYNHYLIFLPIVNITSENS
jgi:hypothetical protein